MLPKVAWLSLVNRKITAMLTVFSIAVSVFVLLGVEHIRSEAKASFSRTVSGVDLIVGARTGPLNLLLYSVFRIGNATNNVSWQSYQELASLPQVAWTIPISLGDSHLGYRVMGTSTDYFEHFRYGKKQALRFSRGQAFNDVFDTVLGAEVANKLGYQLGEKLALSHGTGRVGFTNHDDKPFTVVGILAPTGTPVDQTVHVSLQGIEAIHVDWQNGVKVPGRGISQENALKQDLTPKTITAFMVGLKTKFATFVVQRQVNDYKEEPLLAILPGVALSELWQMMGAMERMLLLISALVLVASLLGMSTMLLASMRERQREIAVLRAVGAGPLFIFLIIELEAIIIAALGVVVALAALSVSTFLAQSYLSDHYGIFIDANVFSLQMLLYIGVIIAASAVLGFIPALSAYRSSLHMSLVART